MVQPVVLFKQALQRLRHLDLLPPQAHDGWVA